LTTPSPDHAKVVGRGLLGGRRIGCPGIGSLVAHFLKRLAEKYSGPSKVLGERAWAAALGYSWPGNLRELENVLERAYLFAPRGRRLL